MFHKNRTRQWLIVALISLISIAAIYYNASPEIYMGYLLALAGIFVVGTFVNKPVAAALGASIVTLGILARKFIPQFMDLKPKALAKFHLQNNQYTQIINQYFWLMILFGVVLAILGSMVGSILEEDRGKKLSTNRITNMAIFIAIAVAINSIRVGIISFGGFPIILSGYVLGPIAGFIVGGVADLLGFIVRPAATAFNPVFTLTSALTGLIPVLVTRLLGERYPKLSFVKVLIGIAVGQLITSVILVPFFSSIFYAKAGFTVIAAQALFKQSFSVPLYAFLVIALAKSLSKAIRIEDSSRVIATSVKGKAFK